MPDIWVLSAGATANRTPGRLTELLIKDLSKKNESMDEDTELMNLERVAEIQERMNDHASTSIMTRDEARCLCQSTHAAHKLKQRVEELEKEKIILAEAIKGMEILSDG